MGRGADSPCKVMSLGASDHLIFRVTGDKYESPLETFKSYHQINLMAATDTYFMECQRKEHMKLLSNKGSEDSLPPHVSKGSVLDISFVITAVEILHFEVTDSSQTYGVP